MLTYATTNDFFEMRDLGKSGLVVVSESGLNKIDTYLQRATRYIERYTRRTFFPYYSVRRYPVPYNFYNLAIRRYPSAHLKLDQDLLEVIQITTTQNNTIVPHNGYFTLEHNIYPKNIIALNFPYYWGGIFAGAAITGRYDSASILVEAVWGYGDGYYDINHWVQLEPLQSALNATDTTIAVEDVDGEDSDGGTRFEAGRLIRIDNEFMEIRRVDDALNTIRVLRGIHGSTAAAHTLGSVIRKWIVKKDIVEATLQTAKAWRESDIAAGGRLGVSDQSVGIEIGVPQDAVEIIKSYQRSIL